MVTAVYGTTVGGLLLELPHLPAAVPAARGGDPTNGAL
jgi:hypothetical protein